MQKQSLRNKNVLCLWLKSSSPILDILKLYALYFAHKRIDLNCHPTIFTVSMTDSRTNFNFAPPWLTPTQIPPTGLVITRLTQAVAYLCCGFSPRHCCLSKVVTWRFTQNPTWITSYILFLSNSKRPGTETTFCFLQGIHSGCKTTCCLTYLLTSCLNDSNTAIGFPYLNWAITHPW